MFFEGGKRLSSFSLRMLALFAMLCDHAALALLPSVGLLRAVGRIAFPLYCFLLVQGFMHTHDLRAYARRLLLLALLSEIPFDLLIFGRLSSPMEQNVLFSLLFALGALYACRTFDAQPLQAFIVCVALASCAMALRLSYGWLSVALCLCFYYTQRRRLQRLMLASGTLLVYSLSLFLSGVERGWALTSLCALFSLVPVLLYSGRPGPRHPALSLAFYLSYPAHLLLLFWLRALRIVPPYFLN